MKNPFLLLSLLAIPCVAQPKAPPAPSPVTVDPAAKTLLDGVTTTYHAAKGIRFKLVVNETQANKGKSQSSYSVSFQKPNLMRLETTSKEQTTKVISDGKASYTVMDTTYKRGDLPGEAKELWSSLNSGTGILTSEMLEGRSPLAVLQGIAKDMPGSKPTLAVSVPPPATVEGVALHGVKFNFSQQKAGASASTSAMVIYVWFGPDELLRRVSTSVVLDGGNFQSTEQISDAELNPTFAPDTFKFSATGLTLAPEPSADEQSEFDPRLKVGTLPFAFTATTLKGETVSPAKYKGKVLILDFWATWCGPCVASMPELRGVYTKYHPKGLEVVGISLDEDKSALTSFIKTNKVVWPQVFDGKGWEARVPGVYGVRAIPFFLIVGKDGKIAAVNPRDDLEGAVKKALAAK